MLKVDQEVSWEGKDKQTASGHKKGFEDIVTSLQSILGNQASTGRNCMHNETMEVPHCKQVDEVGSVQKESEACSDKIVTKIKVPEVIVCFNDGACQIVKDICIDEGLHPLEKFISESNEVTDKISSALKYCLKHANDDLVRGDNGVALITEDTKSPSNFQNDIYSQKSWSSSGAGEEPTTVDKAMSSIHEEKSSLYKMLPVAEANNDTHHTDQGKSGKEDTSEEASFNTTWTLFGPDSDGSNIAPSKYEAYSGTSKPFDATDASRTRGLKENSVNRMSEYQSIHTLLQSDLVFSGEDDSIHANHAHSEVISGTSDSDGICGPMTERSNDVSGADADREPFLKAHNTFSTEETGTNNNTASIGVSFHNNNQEEANFSGPFLSGSKVPSAHIAYSGNISHRSDSSTSIRSFAFPVLQPEWNTSPVRMAEADRRHPKKNRCCWGKLCFKF